jgi:hypothetical protein
LKQEAFFEVFWILWALVWREPSYFVGYCIKLLSLKSNFNRHIK